ncbi:magnesium-protoporphyrin IX monomethyl ester (oxidative) cyclase [Prochlorococcus marinus str. MU1402]|uniref:magnesium-protoporphyrin IX monomethyl ester (oxidative) cyclase n=1 Tax=Prochlorococcus marinus TaxID=1219 RepID=UPI001ADC4F79|nr:magnesium-protoporphyrin IX monomethyl ester (oxidative) cyclase [Prochlorococcus marinus]MBO8232026.1 magnesium-protoporphyrin IX monomethyl ester (oxidative) cyclase [Prochlorococcus marinus XMU1402]MBW3056765.1 magnesium-protoporphyrin IX monomethyl ester (oxidative) cyclase [Prochlorococcus marinus str. MU1402]
MAQSTVESKNKKEINNGKVPAKETILSPRFYTTDFDAMANMDLSINKEELEAICEEFRKDYNRHHFVRNSEFEGAAEKLEPETRELFIDFLEGSCTSEFSGFLLYKELSKRIKDKNPLLAECFAHMARDEARHAGFLNKSMSDFGLQLDLGFLTKSKEYTFFDPRSIFYATYLSEKIGYWRYIAIYRHLEKNPESKIFPLFNYFERWCQDENRHGDFFDALIKAQPRSVQSISNKLDIKIFKFSFTLNHPIFDYFHRFRYYLNNLPLTNRLWSRFFLLAVFATMYLRDLGIKKDFYTSLGLDARDYDQYVINKTNETSARVFPVVLDVYDKSFYGRLDKIVENNRILSDIASSEGNTVSKTFKKLPKYLSNGYQLLRLYLLKPLDSKDFQPSIR